LLATLFGQFPFLAKLFADSAYAGSIFHTALRKIPAQPQNRNRQTLRSCQRVRAIALRAHVRVSDVDLVGSERSALGPGRPITGGSLPGLARALVRNSQDLRFERLQCDLLRQHTVARS
jgi:hypothetical protein